MNFNNRSHHGVHQAPVCTSIISEIPNRKNEMTAIYLTSGFTFILPLVLRNKIKEIVIQKTDSI